MLTPRPGKLGGSNDTTAVRATTGRTLRALRPATRSPTTRRPTPGSPTRIPAGLPTPGLSSPGLSSTGPAAGLSTPGCPTGLSPARLPTTDGGRAAADGDAHAPGAPGGPADTPAVAPPAAAVPASPVQHGHDRDAVPGGCARGDGRPDRGAVDDRQEAPADGRRLRLRQQPHQHVLLAVLHHQRHRDEHDVSHL